MTFVLSNAIGPYHSVTLILSRPGHSKSILYKKLLDCVCVCSLDNNCCVRCQESSPRTSHCHHSSLLTCGTGYCRAASDRILRCRATGLLLLVEHCNHTARIRPSPTSPRLTSPHLAPSLPILLHFRSTSVALTNAARTHLPARRHRSHMNT